MNSPLAKVLENLKVFGKQALRPEKSSHWDAIKRRYWDDRALHYWVSTGRHLPLPKDSKSLRGGEYGMSLTKSQLSPKRSKARKTVSLSQDLVNELLKL